MHFYITDYHKNEPFWWNVFDDMWPALIGLGSTEQIHFSRRYVRKTIFTLLFRVTFTTFRPQIFSARYSCPALCFHKINSLYGFLISRQESLPTWRKCKRAIALRVLRPLENKSTANQRYAISYWQLIVTVAVLLAIREIFSRIEPFNRGWKSPFRPRHSDWRPLAEECPAIST